MFIFKAKNGVVIASEKKFKSPLYDESSVRKVEALSANCGMTYSGLGPDFRLLVKEGRRIAQNYQLVYGENVSPNQLVQKIAAVVQNYTQSGGVRPFGVSLLIAGWDDDLNKPFLYQCDPSGAYFAWKATALGKNCINGRTFLEKRYNEDIELEDAIHTAILTLKENFEGQINETNIEVGVCNQKGFKRLNNNEIKDYLSTIS